VGIDLGRFFVLGRLSDRRIDVRGGTMVVCSIVFLTREINQPLQLKLQTTEVTHINSASILYIFVLPVEGGKREVGSFGVVFYGATTSPSPYN
jgi:hypothetical protein